MSINAEIEQVRETFITLKNWDAIIEEKRHKAAWGCGMVFDDIKVNTTPKHDRMENAVIDVREMDRHKEKLLAKAWERKEELMQSIDQYVKVEDRRILHRYLIGCELSEIPLEGKQKNPKRVVEGALNRLQKAIDRDEEVKRQSEVVQKLIKGGKKKCKHCGSGFIRFRKEEADRFIFECDGCKRKLKADKIGAPGKK